MIVFLRHGQTDWNSRGLLQGRDDIPLNNQGINQAKCAGYELAKALKGKSFKFDKIITSPLSRAEVTAKIISKALGNIPVIKDERLTERDFGILSGKEYDFTSRVVLENVEEASVETVESIVKRVSALIFERIKSTENVLIVTHGAVTRIFAENSKKCPEVSKNGIGIIGNCHMVVYSFDDSDIVLEGYDVAPSEFCEVIK